MRWISRATLAAATSLPLALAAPALASAADASDITFSYTVNGSTVTSTVTNNSNTSVFCGVGLGSAPGGVLPPVEDVLGAGQTLYANGEVQPGTATQTITDIPDGSYVILASCMRTDPTPTIMWVSDYPGIADYLAGLPTTTAFTVGQASTAVTIPHVDTPLATTFPDLAALFES